MERAGTVCFSHTVCTSVHNILTLTLTPNIARIIDDGMINELIDFQEFPSEHVICDISRLKNGRCGSMADQSELAQ
jgi:hypothetical protein